MTEEEAKKFVYDLNIVIVHTDQLTRELQKHLKFIAKQIDYLVAAINK
jgi:SepF-like predicted cell division protein (DUF552 family)